MDTVNKKNIESRFTELGEFVNFFFNGDDESLDVNGREFRVLNYHTRIIASIKHLWETEIIPISDKTTLIPTVTEARFLKSEFDSFFNFVVKTYYANYLPAYQVGRGISTSEYEKLNDSGKEWYNEAEPFLEQKKYLFELLHTYQQQINKICINDLTVVGKSNSRVKKPIPTSFEEIFEDDVDYKKYIDALVNTNPQLLYSDWTFAGNPNTDKGVIASWIYYLQNDLKVIKRFGRADLCTVTNAEIIKLDIKSDKSFEQISVRFNKKFRDQLEAYVK